LQFVCNNIGEYNAERKRSIAALNLILKDLHRQTKTVMFI